MQCEGQMLKNMLARASESGFDVNRCFYVFDSKQIFKAVSVYIEFFISDLLGYSRVLQIDIRGLFNK